MLIISHNKSIDYWVKSLWQLTLQGFREGVHLKMFLILLMFFFDNFVLIDEALLWGWESWVKHRKMMRQTKMKRRDLCLGVCEGHHWCCSKRCHIAVLSLFMSSQINLSLKRSATEITRERFVSRMFSRVCDQIAALTKCFSTNNTLVRLFT